MFNVSCLTCPSSAPRAKGSSLVAGGTRSLPSLEDDATGEVRYRYCRQCDGDTRDEARGDVAVAFLGKYPGGYMCFLDASELMPTSAPPAMPVMGSSREEQGAVVHRRTGRASTRGASNAIASRDSSRGACQVKCWGSASHVLSMSHHISLCPSVVAVRDDVQPAARAPTET